MKTAIKSALEKGLLQRIALLCAFVLMAAGQAAAQENYIIELKNGRQVIVEDYWDDNGTISFDYSGGFVQMPKSMVADIRPTTQAALAPVGRTAPAPAAPTTGPASDMPSAGGPAPDAPVAAAPPGTGPAAAAGPAPAAAGTAPAAAAAPEDLLIQEFRTFEQRYEGRFNMNRTELESLVTDMTRWRDKVLAARVAPFYRNELIKIYDMSDELETLHASTF
jgi:hypothetical protein